MTLARKKVAFLSHRDDIDTLPALERAAYKWLSEQFDYRVELLPFARAERLGEYAMAWWYYTESPELPQAAIDAADHVRAYVENGGKLLLSLIAAKYVDPLGVDRGPDAVVCKDEQFFHNNGYVSTEGHPIFEGLDNIFEVAPAGLLKPFASARWLAVPPETGKVLAIATWGARYVEGERVIVEWQVGNGDIIATGMHNFRFDTEELDQKLFKFATNIFRYMSAPVWADLALEADASAVSKGAGYLGEHYGQGGVVAEEGKGIRAVVSGRAWKPLNITITARTPKGTTSEHMELVPGQRFAITLPLDVKGLLPGEYSAGIEVAEGDNVFISRQQEFFIVPGARDREVIDRHWVWELKSEHISAEIDKGMGVIWGLHDPSDDRKVQFAGNPDNLSALATDEHRWLGDLALKFRFNGDIVWRSVSTAEMAPIRQVIGSDDSVTVSYDPGAPEQTGPTDPAVSQRFSLEGDSLNWWIRVKNRSNLSLILGELAIPMALNTCFAGQVNLKNIYERKVIMHSFIGGSSSWIVAAPFGGRPPYLLIWCKDGARFEAIAHADDYGQKPEGWQGLINVFPYSQASRDTRCWKEWVNGHTSKPILAGEELTMNLGMKFIQDFNEIGETLFESGKVDVDVVPGMVVPKDIPGYLKVRSKRAVTVKSDHQVKTELVRTDGAISIYKFGFETIGEHNITVVDDAGEETSLHFRSIEPIDKLANASAAHIARNQQVRRPGRRNGMFLMWDAEENRIVDNPRGDFMCGGSDEIGFSPVLPLVWKNVYDPSVEEIESLEYYVENFLFKTLQKPDTYEVAAGISDDPNEELDYTRSFNYPHVANIYFALFKIAERYGLTKFRDAEGYLMMTYRTALAYFTVEMYKDNGRTVGNFGESYFVEIISELRKRGHESEADELEQHNRRKAEYFLAKEYPYESEYPFDTTGYAEAYYLKKYAGGLDGAAPTLEMIRATRGRQYSWWWYGGDVRWGWGCSKYPYPDELCLNYMTSQNGRVLLDSFHEMGGIDDLRLGYGAYLAYWALIRPDGVAHNLYTWEPQRMLFDPWSSEMGTGMYFLFNMAASYVVDDPDFGLIGYGCDVEGTVDSHISIIPRDGMAKRVRICPFGTFIETNIGRIDRVDVENGGEKIALLLRESTGSALKAILSVKGLPAGNYTLSANYVEIGSFSADQCAAGLDLSLPANAQLPVHLSRG